MATIFDLANISEAVYTDAGDCFSSPTASGGCLKGWTRTKVSSSKPSGQWFGTQTWAGFYGALFTHRSDAVIAFRGTEFGCNARGFQDLAADVDLALGLWTYQMKHAITFAQECKSSGKFERIYLTGHSLGGALALAASEKHPYPSITFNAPGMANNMALKLTSSDDIHPGQLSSVLKTCSLNNLRLNLRVAYDPVSSASTVGPQAGTNVTLPDPRPRPQSNIGQTGENFGSNVARSLAEGSMDLVEGLHWAGTTMLSGIGVLPPVIAWAQQVQVDAELSARRPAFSDAAAKTGGHFGHRIDKGVAEISSQAKRVAQIVSNPVQMHFMKSMLEALSILDAAFVEIECGTK